MESPSAIRLAFAAMLAWTAGAADVAVERDAGLHETRYTIADGGCRITWITSDTELNRHIIRQHTACAAPPAAQVPLLARVLRAVLDSDADGSRFRVLSWGRLFPDPPADSTLAVRLALEARKSARWDVARGAPRAGDLNAQVRQLARDAPIYPEIRALFREHGLEIELAAVEKVLVLPAGRLPFFPALRTAGAGARDRLPFDCQAWFSIARTVGTMPPQL